MVVTLGQQYNVGEKPTVILYTANGIAPPRISTYDWSVPKTRKKTCIRFYRDGGGGGVNQFQQPMYVSIVFPCGYPEGLGASRLFLTRSLQITVNSFYIPGIQYHCTVNYANNSPTNLPFLMIP